MEDHQKVSVCENPMIYYIDNALTDEECEFIIEKAKPNMKIAGVSVMPGQTGYEKGVYQGRTNKSHWIPKEHYKEMNEICYRLAKIIDCECSFDCHPKFFESFQVIHYEVGQEYKYHYDAYNVNDKAKYGTFCGERGNRLKTILVYLNDVEEGGDTGFDMARPLGEVIKIEPKKGRVVVFDNLKPDGTLNRRSRHAGLPVIKGEKWAFNLWLRERE